MSLEQSIRQLATEDNIQINLWRTAAGYQANVKETAAKGWTCVTAGDVIEALGTALRQRVAHVPDRLIISEDDMQLDLEDAIAAAADSFEDLLG